MVSLRDKKGFTIVELLIVIVVIGILATLVIVTFTGIQQKGRNSQRQTDINAIQSQAEAFFAQHGFYPTLADLQITTAPTFISTYMKGLPGEALKDPKGPTVTMGATTDGDQYSYVASGTACSNTTATTVTSGELQDNGCDAFTVSATLEGSTTPYTKQSN